MVTQQLKAQRIQYEQQIANMRKKLEKQEEQIENLKETIAKLKLKAKRK